MKKIIVIGGGASGMIAAIFAARGGCAVDLFEQNEKLGKKLFITGKGRCNFTNACPREELYRHVVSNPKFLFSAFERFDSQDAIAFFEKLGVKTKVERGNRAFPLSDHSSDIIRALEKELEQLHVRVHLKSRIRSVMIRTDDSCPEGKGYSGKAAGVVLDNGEKIPADRVIVATGGLSYSLTGATGDGYRFGEETGHQIQKCRPALVPLTVKEDYILKLQGLSLKNSLLTVTLGKKKKFSEFGELLFTHFGISGPLALSASSYIAEALEENELPAQIDLKPALTKEQLDERLLREFGENSNREFKNVIPSLFPSKLRPVMLEIGGIPQEKIIHDITREERRKFVDIMKAFPFTITGTRGYNEAVITQGGIRVKEIQPSTMESKKIKDLYFTGEVLDLDAVTGGYNLQIAWSTGYLAGLAAAAEDTDFDQVQAIK